QGIKNTAQETYNNAKDAYASGDGTAFGELGGNAVGNTIIAAATSKGLGVASNSVGVINKADNLADAAGAGRKVDNIAPTPAVKNTAANSAKTPDNLFPDTNTPLLPKSKYEDTYPWAEGVPIVSMDAPENFYINMAQSPGQTGPGGWGTQDYIPNVNYVRNQLAVTPGFKKDVTEVQTYLIPEGIRVQTGTVGPQTHNGVTYPGGGTQVEIYNKQDINKLIPVGKPRPIK
ncbi:MAG: hypothetical protein IJ566_07225, partial [Cardiobacteriaceae bacterium]|nr:hypothetical protein [Cardiobacteriaceae bacterium]